VAVKLCRKKLHYWDNSKTNQCPDCKKVSRSTPEMIQKSTEQARSWRAKNMPHVRSYRNKYKTQRRRFMKLATPKWADLEAIDRFYASCPPGHEVDHIIPFKAKNMCGLHVVENLQYLTPIENRRKANLI